MRSIDFDEGLKSFAINNDESRVIRFNPGDQNLLVRARMAMKELEGLQKQLEDVQTNSDGTAPADASDVALELVKKAEMIINEKINYIFNTDVCKAAFAGQSPISLVGNHKKFLFEAFVESVLPVIEEEINAANAASQMRIEKYTKGYVK